MDVGPKSQQLLRGSLATTGYHLLLQIRMSLAWRKLGQVKSAHIANVDLTSPHLRPPWPYETLFSLALVLQTKHPTLEIPSRTSNPSTLTQTKFSYCNDVRWVDSTKNLCKWLVSNQIRRYVPPTTAYITSGRLICILDFLTSFHGQRAQISLLKYSVYLA